MNPERLFRSLAGLALFLLLSAKAAAQERSAVVFQSDFGLRDGAVSAMKGVAFGVDPAIPLFDLTHEIPPFNIWEAAYRLKQSASYWPSNTVFVSVCDPGVGTERRAVVLRTRSGHRFVTPDNGTLTFIAESLGVEELRVIDIARQRLKGSEDSYTFHGRDLFAYVAARLAAGRITLAEVGSPRHQWRGRVALPTSGTGRGTRPRESSRPRSPIRECLEQCRQTALCRTPSPDRGGVPGDHPRRKSEGLVREDAVRRQFRRSAGGPAAPVCEQPLGNGCGPEPRRLCQAVRHPIRSRLVDRDLPSLIEPTATGFAPAWSESGLGTDSIRPATWIR